MRGSASLLKIEPGRVGFRVSLTARMTERGYVELTYLPLLRGKESNEPERYIRETIQHDLRGEEVRVQTVHEKCK